MTSIADELGNDQQIHSAAADVPGTLHQAADTIGKSVTLIRAGEKAESPPWIWPKVALALLVITGAIYFWIERKRFKSQALVHAAPSICIEAARSYASLGIARHGPFFTNGPRRKTMLAGALAAG